MFLLWISAEILFKNTEVYSRPSTGSNSDSREMLKSADSVLRH